MAGGLILAEKVEGSIMAIILLILNAIFYSNPWVFYDQTEQRQSWILLLKHVAAVGGALFVMTRGILRRED